MSCWADLLRCQSTTQEDKTRILIGTSLADVYEGGLSQNGTGVSQVGLRPFCLLPRLHRCLSARGLLSTLCANNCQSSLQAQCAPTGLRPEASSPFRASGSGAAAMTHGWLQWRQQLQPVTHASRWVLHRAGLLSAHWPHGLVAGMQLSSGASVVVTIRLADPQVDSTEGLTKGRWVRLYATRGAQERQASAKCVCVARPFPLFRAFLASAWVGGIQHSGTAHALV